jgi:hypothetical protein
MTEAEWQQFVNVEPMLVGLRRTFGGEKIRLFGCLVYRRVWDRLDDGFRYLLDITEEWATSAISFEEWRGAWERNPNPFQAGAFGDDAQIVRSLATSTYGYVLSAAWRAAVRARQMAVSHAPAESLKGFEKAERKWQAVVLRDLYGNPFRPVAADPSWLTSTVVQLAEGIYRDRAFDRMPILADALQDAGCENEDVLNHCRQPGVHARGCWLVDLLTGRK